MLPVRHNLVTLFFIKCTNFDINKCSHKLTGNTNIFHTFSTDKITEELLGPYGCELQNSENSATSWFKYMIELPLNWCSTFVHILSNVLPPGASFRGAGRVYGPPRIVKKLEHYPQAQMAVCNGRQYCRRASAFTESFWRQLWLIHISGECFATCS